MDGSDGVYPASEDTYLLIDAIKQDEGVISGVLNAGGTFLEVGCGSGEVTAFLASTFNATVGFCTDVNSRAIGKTSRLLNQQETTSTDLILCDLFSAFRPGTSFSIIVFNPPYVPTLDDEFQRALTTCDISASWAGGKLGREVIDKFLDSVEPFLSAKGLLYLVVLEDNLPEEITARAKENGLECSKVLRRTAGIEKLQVLRFKRSIRADYEDTRVIQ